MNDIIGAWGVVLSCKSLLPIEYNNLRSFIKSNFRGFAHVNISFSGTRYLTMLMSIIAEMLRTVGWVEAQNPAHLKFCSITHYQVSSH